MEASLWVQNLADTSETDFGTVFAGAGAVYGPPLTFGADLKFNF
jgi:hypothetical protein